MIIAADMSPKEIVNDLKETYSKVRKLLDEDSKNDPPNEPYLSKYKAKDILNNMRDALSKVTESETNLSQIDLNAILGIVLLNIGIIDMETDELTASESILREAEALLLPDSLKPEIVTTLINVLNNLGILWSNRDDPRKAKVFLLSAKTIYEDFKCTLQMPVPIEQILCNKVAGDIDVTGDFMILEKAHTLTLYYLAQVYGCLLEPLKSAIYCHVTLRRQLQYSDYEPIDWALNSATLSQFFAERNGFFQARHHLAAASTILDLYEAVLNESESTDEAFLAKKETLKHRSADVAKCWAKYCLMLMHASKKRLMTDSEAISDSITDMSNLDLEDNENICGGDIKNLIFHALNVSKYERKIGDKFILTYEDAREVYFCCQGWLNKAKEYYRLDSLASDYILLVQDSSEIYNLLAFFEEDDERRSKMHKRRIDMLEELLKDINPTYYLQFCREIWFEIGLVYSDILNIKLDKLNKTNEKPTPQQLKKINMLCEKSIENFELFIESVKDKNGILQQNLEIDIIKHVVNAYAFIGSNSMKRISVDKNVRLSYIKKSYASYQQVTEICKNIQEAANMMKEEYSLCQEMVNILPLKIKKLENESVS